MDEHFNVSACTGNRAYNKHIFAQSVRAPELLYAKKSSLKCRLTGRFQLMAKCMGNLATRPANGWRLACKMFWKPVS